MAKRFTDTNKYKKPFIRCLKGAYKLFWDFLYHDCDHAGIWIVDFEIAQFYIGLDMPVNKKEALRFFNESEQRIVELDGGKKWFIPSFIEFQYGELRENNRAHVNVISVLKKYNLIDENFNIKIEREGASKPLTRPLQGAKEQEQEQEKEKDIGTRVLKKENSEEENINPIPEKKPTSVFIDASCVPELKATKSFKQFTEEEFRTEIGQFTESYHSDILNGFYRYWKEKSASGKMRFQLEQTWETSLRLQTWKRNQDKFESKSKTNGTTQHVVGKTIVFDQP